ncbi:MAG: FKBP-type peptidyl-prolyl cis-trans isomerase [Bacteroidota bacterium]
MMNKIVYVLAICLFFAACNGGQNADQANTQVKDGKLQNQLDSISYAMGADLSNQLQRLGLDIVPGQLLQGFKDFTTAGDEGLASASEVIKNFSLELRQRQGKPFTADDKSNTNMDSLSYALGIDYSNRLIDGGIDINGELVASGCAAFANNSAQLDSLQIAGLMREMSQMMRVAAEKKAKEDGIKNEATGKAFLEENAKKDGVKTTASGLQYKVLKAGNGPSPAASNTVKVHYEGRLIDGKVFDSSIERGEPIEFQLTGVIPGWTEGLQLMNTGAKYQFYIPQNLAYGAQGPPSIGPMQTLIFDVELLEVK